jgi:hypothetical protein
MVDISSEVFFLSQFFSVYRKFAKHINSEDTFFAIVKDIALSRKVLRYHRDNEKP